MYTIPIVKKTFTSLFDKKDNSNILSGQEIKIKTNLLFESRFVTSHVPLPFPQGRGKG